MFFCSIVDEPKSTGFGIFLCSIWININVLQYTNFLSEYKYKRLCFKSIQMAGLLARAFSYLNGIVGALKLGQGMDWILDLFLWALSYFGSHFFGFFGANEWFLLWRFHLPYNNWRLFCWLFGLIIVGSRIQMDVGRRDGKMQKVVQKYMLLINFINLS